MRSILVAASVLMLGSAAHAAPAADAYNRCLEASGETLASAVPKSARAKIIQACERALRAGATEAACDREADRAGRKMALPVAYTCKSAIGLE